METTYWKVEILCKRQVNGLSSLHCSQSLKDWVWHSLTFNSHSTSFFKTLTEVLVCFLVMHISTRVLLFSLRLKGFWGCGGSGLFCGAEGVNFSGCKFIKILKILLPLVGCKIKKAKCHLEPGCRCHPSFVSVDFQLCLKTVTQNVRRVM